MTGNETNKSLGRVRNRMGSRLVRAEKVVCVERRMSYSNEKEVWNWSYKALVSNSFTHRFSSVTQSCLTATPWIAACQASLSITSSRSSLKLMSIESVMPSSHLILCRPLLLLPPIPPSIRVFSNESTLCMRWPKYWSMLSLIEECNIISPGYLCWIDSRNSWIPKSAKALKWHSTVSHEHLRMWKPWI